MESCLYEGYVQHARHKPVQNAFRYSVFFLYLDFAEIDRVFIGRWLWSSDRFNIACLRRKDHFGDSSVPLEEAVRKLVEQRTGRRPSGHIRMLTHLRYFGHNFNPASFYYCYAANGSSLETIVVEIHNTPWREVFCYVLDEAKNEGASGEKRFRLPKAFHVSPFMDMNIEYDWRFTEPGTSLSVNMISFKQEQEIFRANLDLERREITGRSLARVLAQYPLMTVKVIAAIYWQALRLRIKGAPFYSHPAKGKAATEVQ
jgi:uncharacterized protein